jgi:3-hydroxybutyryl-CoA dehydrogenase
MATIEPAGPPPRLVAVGAGRMGRGIAIAFAWAGHRIAVVDLKRRSAAEWQALRADARAEIDASLKSLAELGAVDRARIDAIAARLAQLEATAPAASARLRRTATDEHPAALPTA